MGRLGVCLPGWSMVPAVSSHTTCALCASPLHLQGRATLLRRQQLLDGPSPNSDPPSLAQKVEKTYDLQL